MSAINALDDTGASRPPLPTSESAPASRVALKTDIVVIGAGQAGLSSAYHLKKRGLAPGRGFVVLDQSPQPGGAWQFRWPSLRLSTVNRIHDLPGMRFSEAVDTDATEVEASVAVPRYFAAYEKAFDLPVYRPVRVTVVCDRGERLRIETDRGSLSARGVINATGTWETAYIPDISRSGPVQGQAAAHQGLPNGRGVRRQARYRGRRRHLGDTAARRGLARHHHDLGHPQTAGVPRGTFYRRTGPRRRGAGRRPGAPRLAAEIRRFGDGAAGNPGYRGHASPRGAGRGCRCSARSSKTASAGPTAP